MGVQTARLRGNFSWPGRVSAGRAAFALAAALAVVPVGATRAQQFNNYQQLGCYYHAAEKRLWIAAVGLTPKALDKDTYDDPGFQIIYRIGNQDLPLEGKDAVVNVMKDFDFKGAEKYKLVKYSLAVDYSGSIGSSREQVINFIDKFLGKLPLALEGQLIRFSDNVEKFPFTTNKSELQLQLRQPIQYGSTALNDAFMEAATSLVREGSNTPVRILVMFTDGFDNSSKTYRDRQSFIATFTSLAVQEKLIVLVIGVTNEQDTDLLNAVTDRSKGIAGYYAPVPAFDKLGGAFDQFANMMRNIVLFRLPKLGPDKGSAVISIVMRSKAGSATTLQQFRCDY
jgi:hypothetical protein